MTVRGVDPVGPVLSTTRGRFFAVWSDDDLSEFGRGRRRASDGGCQCIRNVLA
jgi:hypothetical protein